ncbi:integrase [Pseudonocardia sp.]|jgi:integrase|uniref:tyrosine-type recombinase/integrase n=1 Tax=Pseudonocardia sp. TaxID=60912 RepID=UPI0031FCE101
METTYDVRFWATRTYKGSTATTYYVRWKVAGSLFQEGFRTTALAESFRSRLLAAASQGEAFALSDGRPVSQRRIEDTASWFDFACSYVDMKWPEAAGKSRMGIAETLATVTPILLQSASGRPNDETIRRALYQWAFNARARESDPPSDLVRAARWLQSNTRPVSDLNEPDVLRAVMAAIGRRLDGKAAAASTTQRKRAVFYNAMEYAVERKLLARNPLAVVKVKNRKTADEVDRRVVVNIEQARRLLDAVVAEGKSGKRLVAFFALMYYAALRPGEAAHLSRSALRLPAEGWGELFLPGSAPTTGTAWSDSGRRRDERGLKHRAREAIRVVPCAPPLATLLRSHLDEHGTAKDGRLFRSMRRDQQGDLSDSVYGRVWAKARAAALTPEEAASPLARRPYDLRHAAVSTWLNAVPPTQVAEWAGHSVAVLLRVYAKCISGQEDAARQRVGLALGLG